MNDYATINADAHAASQLPVETVLAIHATKLAEALARIEAIETHLRQQSYNEDSI